VVLRHQHFGFITPANNGLVDVFGPRQRLADFGPTQRVGQVLLSFGIALALVPLLIFTSDKSLMGELVNSVVVKRIGWVNSLRVYIEGDGFAWKSRTQPSGNPTPHNPVALKLAASIRGGCSWYGRSGCNPSASPPATGYRVVKVILKAIMILRDRRRSALGGNGVATHGIDF
jgi:hypothetical protein